jgi:hypothetical protein
MLNNNKKAAMEMSMGTIVVLVLGVSMLILGMVLIRNIMCSGLSITDDLSAGVKNEIKNLFGADKFGVKCLGQGGAEVKLGSGGKRPVICILKTDAETEYEITVTSVESLSGAKTDILNKWVIDKGWKGSVIPGQEQEETVLLFDIPRDAPNTAVKITLQVKNLGTGSQQTITSRVEIVSTGFVAGAIC